MLLFGCFLVHNLLISASMGGVARNSSLPEHWRKKIKTGAILNRLNSHTLGEIEMTPSQIQAARILLSKTMPDLKAIEQAISGGVTINVVDPIVRPDDTNG